MTTFIEEYRAIFFVVTFALLAWAFYLTYRRRGSAADTPRSRIMTFNKVMLWAVTVVVVVFLFFPNTVTALLTADNEFTADMQRTVISVEGMT